MNSFNYFHSKRNVIIFFIIFAIGVLILVSLNIFRNQMQSKADIKNSSQNQPEFISNQILIKFSEKGLANLKAKQPKIISQKNPSFPANNTGISELDQINKNFKATQINKASVGDDVKGSNLASDLDRWYVINLDVPQKKIKGDQNEILVENGSYRKITYRQMLDLYRRTEGIEKAELNNIFTTSMVPNDYFWTSSAWFGDHNDAWNLKIIGSEPAWDRVTGSGVVVAVVDTGVDYNHPDLTSNMLRSNGQIVGYDFVNNDTDPMGDNPHGTHVAGIIGAQANNDLNHSVDSGTRTIGLGFGLKIMPIKSIKENGQGDESNLMNGIRWAVDHGANVINNSWGGAGDESQFAQDTIKYAHDRNVVVVFSAGNSNGDIINVQPAGDKNAITVGSTNYEDNKSCFSNFGVGMDLMAPGGDSTSCGGATDGILSTINSSSFYNAYSGTSMAAPHVAAAAGLILALHPDWTPEEVRFALNNTADILNGGWNQKTGSGRLNIARATALNLAPPVASLNLSEKVWLIEEVFGSVSARTGVKNWSLSIGKVEDSSSVITNWTILSSGLTSISGKIADINATNYDGIYVLKLEVTDNNNQTSRVYNDARFSNQAVPSWPQANENQSSWINSHPAIGDINGDGNNEIVITTYYVYEVGLMGPQVVVYKADGTIVPGFPKVMEDFNPSGFFSSPTLADLNNDGKMEILFTNSHNINDPNDDTVCQKGFSRVFAFDGNGDMLAGWPLDFTDNWVSMPVVTDINNDNEQEIIFQGSENKIFVYNRNGQPLAGWPATLSNSNIKECFVYGDLAVRDIDNDLKKEIFASFHNRIYAYRSSGQPLAGWPKKIYSSASDTISDFRFNLADINSDGKQEIIFRPVLKNNILETKYNMFVWDLGGNLLFDQTSAKDLGYSYGGVAFIKDFTLKVINSLSPAYNAALVLDHNGTNTSLKDNWPIFDSLGMPLMSSGLTEYLVEECPPDFAIADINNDKIPEILFGGREISSQYTLMATDLNGQIKNEYGKGITLNIQSPAIGDIDGDGILELVANSIPMDDGPTGTYVWKTTTVVPKNTVVWSQYRGDAARTATYQPPSALKLTADKTQVGSQDEVIYTISFINPLLTEAKNVVVSSLVPSGTTFLSANDGGTMNSGVVRWPSRLLSPGDTFVTQYKVKKN